ncbi:hypothetical protein CRG98_015184 [Punica granatum]|uniref:Uncharacterized protein n=1 Tax=Punica granatum TaxID=22663 RepID=A0A2I0K770_PUNGR|nr:hypothetical protein CRG98_015184 [Punica granatum]
MGMTIHSLSLSKQGEKKKGTGRAPSGPHRKETPMQELQSQPEHYRHVDTPPSSPIQHIEANTWLPGLYTSYTVPFACIPLWGGLHSQMSYDDPLHHYTFSSSEQFAQHPEAPMQEYSLQGIRVWSGGKFVEKYTQASQSHGSATFCRRSRTRFGRMRSVETIRHSRTADQCNDDVRGSLGIMHSRLDIHDSLMQYIRAALHKLTGVPISSNLARGKQHCTDCSQGTGHKKDDDGDDDDD